MEEDLIKLITKSIPDSQNFIGDDAAVINIGNDKFLFSIDNFIEDVHYSNNYFSPYDIGWKALAVNISDIAAMRGLPLWFMVGLSLSPNIKNKPQWIEEFYSGIQDCAKKFGNPKLIGGDITASSSKTMISISIVGRALAEPCLRSHAQPGDILAVTGKFGNSASFLERIQKQNLQSIPSWLKSEWESQSSDIQYHLRPEPRLQEAESIEGRAALMDTSDGLAQAILNIAQNSKVNIELDTNIIPKDQNIETKLALYGAEDYELVACLEKPPSGFHPIGRVLSYSDNPQILDKSGYLALDPQLIYKHF